MTPSYRLWFNAIAWRVLFSRIEELGIGAAVSTALRLSPDHEMPIGCAFHIAFAPVPVAILGAGLGLVELEIGIGRTVDEGEEPAGYAADHLAQIGSPPMVRYQGRWFWLRMARAW